jgi:hypothetical protein
MFSRRFAADLALHNDAASQRFTTFGDQAEEASGVVRREGEVEKMR